MLLVSPKNLHEALRLEKYCDAYLVGYEKYCAKHRNLFCKEDIIRLLNTKKRVIVRLDLILFEENIGLFNGIINELKEYDLYYYVNDLGCVNILKKYNLISKTIYDPLTMITNKLDGLFYQKLNLDAFGVSLEIPVYDALSFNDLNVFYQVFGLREMFSSKRKVISLYLKSRDFKDKISSNMNLIEQTRNDSYQAYEDESGTYIYRSYLINLIKHLKEFNFKYLFLDSLNINFDIYEIVVKTYYNYLNDLISLDEAISTINNLDLHIEDGFTYKDSVYQKEDLKNEKI